MMGIDSLDEVRLYICIPFAVAVALLDLIRNFRDVPNVLLVRLILIPRIACLGPKKQIVVDYLFRKVSQIITSPR